MTLAEPIHFLLVDDLDENLLSLEALLRRDGLVLLKARSGDEGLELLLRYEVALALVDVQMPGLSGFEFAELMRGSERTRRIPIIFVTAGSADSQRRFRGYEAGAVDFIHKPIEPDVLRSKADVFFELFRQRQQIMAQRDALDAQSQALKEADRRKDEFLAILAHELRNPMAPLRHGLDVLRTAPNDADNIDICGMMDRQLNLLVRLTDDLLDVSRVSRGKIVLQRQAIQAADIIGSALETSRPAIEAANHSLSLDIVDEPLWLDADPTRLAQVVSNLLNNAAKYTPDDGHIAVSLQRGGESAVIAVSDSGVGIPFDRQSEVFELFTQIDQRADRSRGGLGIGLALVKQLVAMHGGSVEAFSEGVGKGSVFTVRLPLIAAPELREKPTIGFDPAAQAQRGLKVLVVDDNQDVAQTMGWLLEAIGHHYAIIHDGREAVQVAREYQPDAILLDIGMPEMDGYAVCRALRQDPLFATTPIIAQTGWGQERDKALALAAGFDHHLVKPVGLGDLEQLLSTIGTRASA